MRRIFFVLVPLALALLAGCPSLSTLQTPSTVPKGDLRFGVGLEAVGFSETVNTGAGEQTTTVTVPQTEFSARYGATDEIDVGAKLYFLGVEVGAKYQVLRGQFDVAVAPAISYISVTVGSGDSESKLSVAYIHLPILMGYNVSDVLTLGFGPKLLYTIASGSAESGDESSSVTASGLMAGGYGQIAYRIGDAFWLAPEFNVYKPFAENTSGIVFQGGLALLFGGGPKAQQQPMGQPMGQPVGAPGGMPSQ